MTKPTILLLGKLPPPAMGPAIATQILLGSALTERYRLVHVDTNVHASIRSIGSGGVRSALRHVGVMRRMARALRDERPDLVIVPISQSTGGFAKDAAFIGLAKRAGCPVLVHLRGSNMLNWLAGATPITRAMVRRVLGWADGAIVLGEMLRPLFADFFPPERVYVAPNGADYTLPERTRPPRDAVGEVALLYLANLQPTKGIEDVVRAVARLHADGVGGFRLHVVGAWRDAPTQQTCEALVADGGLPVTFHGPAYGPDKLAHLADADVFVFTPRAPEGHPWVIVEALAAGLPVVATDRGAITESVTDGENGVIVPGASPDDLAAALARLIQDADLRRAMGAASRAAHAERFTEAAMVARLSATIDHALALSGAPAATPAASTPSATAPPSGSVPEAAPKATAPQPVTADG